MRALSLRANRSKWQWLIGLAIVAVATTGCPKSSSRVASDGGKAGGAHRYRIAVIPKGTLQSYWLTVKAGAEQAAKEDNAEILWDGPQDERDVSKQINIVQAFINRRVEAIVMAACDAHALVRYVKQAQQAGIPVVTVDSGITPDISSAFVATDNVKGGAIAADTLAKLIGGKGTVGLMPFIKGAESSDQREQGFRQEIAKYPNIHLGPVLYSESNVEKGLERMLNMMTSTPNLAGVFAANQSGVEGAASALQQQGKAGKIKLVGFDASDIEIAKLKAGVIQALIVQNPYKMGYEGVQLAIRAIKKEPIQQRHIDTGVTVVTMQNFNTPAVQKLLYPLKNAN